MEITYINDEYDETATAFYKKSNVALPIKGMTYTIRKVLLVKEQYVLVLNEIVNQTVIRNFVPMGEPGFHYARFTDTPGNVLEWEIVDRIYKSQL